MGLGDVFFRDGDPALLVAEQLRAVGQNAAEPEPLLRRARRARARLGPNDARGSARAKTLVGTMAAAPNQDYVSVVKHCRRTLMVADTLGMYLAMQKRYSPELKLVTLVEKFQLALMAMATVHRETIEDELPSSVFADENSIPPQVKALIDKSTERLTAVSNDLIEELSVVIEQLCSGDSIVSRVDANIEKLLYHPDTYTGKAIMQHSRRDFEGRAAAAAAAATPAAALAATPVAVPPAAAGIPPSPAGAAAPDVAGNDH